MKATSGGQTDYIRDYELWGWWDIHRNQAERERRRQMFLDRFSLKPSKARKAIAKVAGRRICSTGDYYDIHAEQTAYPKALGWFDHTELFHSPTLGYVLTTQPYDLTRAKVEALEALCFEFGLTVTVQVSDGWHYPGCCPLVVVYRQGMLPAKAEQ